MKTVINDAVKECVELPALYYNPASPETIYLVSHISEGEGCYVTLDKGHTYTNCPMGGMVPFTGTVTLSND